MVLEVNKLYLYTYLARFYLFRIRIHLSNESVVSREYYSEFQFSKKRQEKIQKKVPQSSSALRNTIQSLVRKIGTVNPSQPISCNMTELETNVSVACFIDVMDASTTSSNVYYTCAGQAVQRLEATACSKTQTSRLTGIALCVSTTFLVCTTVLNRWPKYRFKRY